MFFPIIYSYHVIALALPMIYNPSIFLCVIAWVHFGLFIGLLILNIFVKEVEPGQGARTSATRILWGSNSVVI